MHFFRMQLRFENDRFICQYISPMVELATDAVGVAQGASNNKVWVSRLDPHESCPHEGPLLLLQSDAGSRLANGSAAFVWKLHCHWLKGFWHQIPVVIQAPGWWAHTSENALLLGKLWFWHHAFILPLQEPRGFLDFWLLPTPVWFSNISSVSLIRHKASWYFGCTVIVIRACARIWSDIVGLRVRDEMKHMTCRHQRDVLINRQSIKKRSWRK